MKFRVEVVCVDEEGEELRSDVLAMERHQLAMETLGLNLSESKAMLEGVQDFVVAQQAAEDLRRRRRCPSCGECYSGKAGGTIEVKTLFGAVEVANPRWKRCTCQESGPKTFRPAAAWLVGQTSPELLYLETKWASVIPFAKVAGLLREVLPVDDGTNHETIRRHLQATAQRMEDELGEERQLSRGHRRRLCPGGTQGGLLRSDRRAKCGGVPPGCRGRGPRGKMFRLCANLRSEVPATSLGIDEITRLTGQPAGGLYVRRR